MKPAFWQALATLGSALFVSGFTGEAVFAATGHPAATVHGGTVGHTPGAFRPRAGFPFRTPVNQTAMKRQPVQFKRRAPLFVGVNSYAYDYPSFLPPVYPQLFDSPINVDTGIPVDAEGGVPPQADVPPLCTGPRIIEIGNEKRQSAPLPRIISAMPLNCVPARTARGGSIESVN
jgi:hypothetical protein